MLFIICIVIILIAYLIYRNNFTSPSNQVIIDLQELGFSPQKITIQQGDTVIFRTTLNTPFWPASDLHPTHEIYSEFDPQEPIDPHNTWSFNFQKKGTWDFHDHLNPFFRGQIIVK
jgi:plastocyanin